MRYGPRSASAEGREQRREGEAGSRDETGATTGGPDRERDHLVHGDHDHRSRGDALDDRDEVVLARFQERVTRQAGDEAHRDDRTEPKEQSTERDPAREDRSGDRDRFGEARRRRRRRRARWRRCRSRGS